MARVLFLTFILLAAIGITWFVVDVHIPAPLADGELAVVPQRLKGSDGRWHVGRNWLGQDSSGLHEVYIEGGDLERGLAYGALAKELISEQERIFTERLQAMLPGKGRATFLKYFAAWFDRDLDEHVPDEYLREIYGVSRSFSDRFDEVGPKFIRALNYHAAHDIGHALQDLAMVGCTSFAVWDGRTPEGDLLVARNFDFWMGDEFARDKLITFVRPEHGIPHAFVSWGGFMGAASAMNLEGLTVTINAARSEVPTSARMPIALLARGIVQHAATLDEAIIIARQHEVFVSESILVSSARDGRAVIIEKAPDGMDVFTPEGDLVVCANHYQSPHFAGTAANVENIRDSDSMARHQRMQELVDSLGTLDPAKAALILRDRRALDATERGMGDPSVINQLIAHHAVVFRPEERLMWVSTAPYQCGAFVCYDLRDVFARCATGRPGGRLAQTGRTIAPDPFITSRTFARHAHWTTLRMMIAEHRVSGRPLTLTLEEEERFLRDNPRSFITYVALGDLRQLQGLHAAAAVFYRKALSLPISSKRERAWIEEQLARCEQPAS